MENIVADTTIFSTNWVYEGSVTKSVTSGVLTLNMPANTSDRCFCSIPGGLARKTVLFHLDIYSNSPTTIDLSIQGNITTVNHAVLNITTGYRRYSLPAFTFNAGDAGAYFLITNTEALAKTLFIKNPQIEDVTGQANQKPSEYVSNGVLSAPYHGAGAD